MDNTQQAVTRQYEDFPYPARDPQDDARRLIVTWLDDLGLLNHHCYRGAKRFHTGFRILVAGGGTGDGTIFLAEQLRGNDVRIVHLDPSGASISIAKERARVRGLAGIEWIQASLLDLPELALGEFDYINCVGVLHHLDSPEAGLDALRAVLAPGGAMGLMVYGQLGRTGVYQLQALLRTLNGTASVDEALALTKGLLSVLPGSNWFKRGEALHPDHRHGDAGIADLLLHPQDRAFTVPQLHEWIEDRCGLHITFSDVHRGRLPYTPERVLVGADAGLAARLVTLSPRDRATIAELAAGDITMHTFYATRDRDARAPYGDAAYIPFFLTETPQTRGADVAALIDHHGGAPFLLQHAQSRLAIPMECGPHVRTIFGHIDGYTTFGTIFDRIRIEAGQPSLSNDALFAEFAPWFDALGLIDRLLLSAY